MKLEDIKGDRDYEISLVKLVGKDIKDVYGYLSDIGGGVTFKLTRIAFVDSTMLRVEGEHDFPYLVNHGEEQPNFDDETLGRLYNESE
jgi:hypothetical protein